MAEAVLESSLRADAAKFTTITLTDLERDKTSTCVTHMSIIRILSLLFQVG